VYQRYNDIKKMNNVYDDIPLLEFEVDLNTISADQLEEYKLFQIKTTVSSTVMVNNARLIDKIEFDLLEDLPNLFSNIDKFAKEHNITKQDKLLFICEGGKSTQVLSLLFNNAGYKASFARLKRLVNDKNNIINIPIKKNSKLTSKLIVVPYKWRNTKKQDIYITFDLIGLSKFLDKKEIEKLEVVYYEDVKNTTINEKNIICSFNFHCVLVKYLLDAQGINERKIFKIPIEEELYNDIYLYNLPSDLRETYEDYPHLIEQLKNES